MELIVMVGAVLLLDILAMRFGVDSRIHDSRGNGAWWSTPPLGDAHFDTAHAHLADVRYEAHAFGLAALATLTTDRPSIRMRMADGLRTLAARIDPAGYLPADSAATPVRAY